MTRPDGRSDARRLARAALLAHQARTADALEVLDAHPFVSQFDVAACLLKAQLLAPIETGRCWTTYADALARYPDHAVLNLRAGVFAYRRGDMERARALLARSWAAAPNAEAGFHLGQICADTGDAERAIPYFAQVIAFEDERGYWRAAAAAALESGT